MSSIEFIMPLLVAWNNNEILVIYRIPRRDKSRSVKPSNETRQSRRVKPIQDETM
jgi:hypothetical protein